MKKLYITMCIIMLVCIAGTAVLMSLMPDRVPMHYNAAGEADRIGSKYENLILPGIVLLLGASFVLAARHERKKAESSNEKLYLIVGVCMAGFFTLLGFYFMWKAMRFDPDASAPLPAENIGRFTGIGIGILLIVLGNFMPKARMNSVVGLRTVWSMANESVWQKSQRFAGIAAVIAGFLIIVLSLFIPGMWNYAALLAVVIAFGVISTAASYRYYKADKESKANADPGNE